MKRLLLSVFLLASVFFAKGQSVKEFSYRSGDLLFQDLDCGGLCDAIEAVTPALEGRHFSHIGLVYVAGDSVYVIEAIGKDVHVSSINTFLDRQADSAGRPKVVVGRLKPGFAKLIVPAVTFALKQVGKGYDEFFLPDNGKYYCSELIYDAFKQANAGEPFFHLYPMTFKDPGTRKTMPVWRKYYHDLGKSIPEGKPGCNPGSIAINDNVDIVARFY